MKLRELWTSDIFFKSKQNYFLEDPLKIQRKDSEKHQELIIIIFKKYVSSFEFVSKFHA